MEGKVVTKGSERRVSSQDGRWDVVEEVPETWVVESPVIVVTTGESRFIKFIF